MDKEKVMFIICSELNGDSESCKEEDCGSCPFKLDRLEETAEKILSSFKWG